MFEKQVKKPLNLLQLEILQERVEPNKKNLISEQLSNYLVGYYGEQTVAYYLRSKRFHQCKIFNNLRIKFNSQVFQIDFLLVHRNFLLLLECKNIQGNLTLESNSGQFLRTKGQVDEGFMNPIYQVEKQASMLSQFLLYHHFPPIPIYTYVVIPKPSTVLKTEDKSLLRKFVYAYQLEEKINELYIQSDKNFLTPTEQSSLCQLFIKFHEDLSLNWKKRFSLSKEDIRSGVQCSKCKKLGMHKERFKWVCTCGNKEKNAHCKALIEYSILFSSTVTLADCKRWLLIDSDRIVRRLIKPYIKNKVSNNRFTQYELDIEKIKNSIHAKDSI